MPDVPQALFQAGASTFGYNQAYGVTKDGQRFLVNVRPQQSSGTAPLTVVLNWTAAIHNVADRAEASAADRR